MWMTQDHKGENSDIELSMGEKHLCSLLTHRQIHWSLLHVHLTSLEQKQTKKPRRDVVPLVFRSS